MGNLLALRQYFKVIFRSHGEIVELYAAQIFQSELLGFIEVEELLFDDNIHPDAEFKQKKMKTMFDNVRRVFLPLNTVVRIDELEFYEVIEKVEKKGNITMFPKRKKTETLC